jgi:hypothetical protein
MIELICLPLEQQIDREEYERVPRTHGRVLTDSCDYRNCQIAMGEAAGHLIDGNLAITRSALGS